MSALTPARTAAVLAVLGLGLATLGCSDRDGPGPLAVGPEFAPSQGADAARPGGPGPEPPEELRTVSFGPLSLELWPFTGTDFSAAPLDPMNLFFVGEADPANIRSILLSLDGDRTAQGLPPVPPFNCTWQDAAGGIQTGWADDRWRGSAVQLECGDYQTVRFHLRLFPAGNWTAANAHFEVLIPGTPNHQVLSWNLARDFVAGDLARSGMLDGAAPFGAAIGLTPGPTFRTIPAVIYNGLPAPLRDLTGGPPIPTADDVGIPNDGLALIANVAARARPAVGSAHHDFTIEFNQVIPKPFCGGPAAFVHVAGPVAFTHRVAANAAGEVSAQIQVVGALAVTPVDPATGMPSGETRNARTTDHYSAATLGRDARVSSTILRVINAAGGAQGVETEEIRLRVGPEDLAHLTHRERCQE